MSFTVKEVTRKYIVYTKGSKSYNISAANGESILFIRSLLKKTALETERLLLSDKGDYFLTAMFHGNVGVYIYSSTKSKPFRKLRIHICIGKKQEFEVNMAGLNLLSNYIRDVFKPKGLF